MNSFNSKHGYLEAILRGFRSGFLNDSEYRQLTQCETLEDFKLCFQETDFAEILSSIDINMKLTSQVVQDRVWHKFVEEFEHLRNQATGELATFLHYIQYQHMIENVSFLISGLINQNDPLELLADCDEAKTAQVHQQFFAFRSKKLAAEAAEAAIQSEQMVQDEMRRNTDAAQNADDQESAQLEERF